ncbi:MAD2 [Auxenochlorella protothecoides x Auxenochlorella symbiontica]|uniref:HORMA domain-containing protein n=1 Tax=Auxenochlorella protothecoides TaxID=3075 RepID=A0A1D2A6C6_AUXPR
MATTVATRNTVTLRGSTATVTEFFQTALSSILYQRGVYPPESFEPRKKYGLTVMAVKDSKLESYLDSVLTQFKDWLALGTLQQVVLVIASRVTKQVQERWAFDIQTDKDVISTQVFPEKPEAQITGEIQAIIRQITASITFLPLLSDACTIDLLAYTDRACEVPGEWEESDPRYISNAADVKLRSFSTKVHSVATLVSYKADEDAY